ncbi:MAG: 3-deoxy-manno-octulosonate cytidylyltransferase [Vicinamibacterales bacterium]
MPASATARHPGSPPPPRVVVVIPSRWASSRLPGKPLADIGGVTMVERVYRRAAAARGIAGVIVATDDDRIAEEVARFGGAWVMTRPDHLSGTDRIAEVARGLSCDIVINVQGDEPALDPAAIEAAAAPLAADPSVLMGTIGAPLDEAAELQNPNAVKVLVDRQGFALYFSRAPVPYRREAGQAFGAVLRHVGLYAYRREFLLTLASLPRTPLERIESLEQLRALEHGYRIRVVETASPSVPVDTPEDLERVRRLAADGLLP